MRLRWGRIIAAELAVLAGLGLLHQFDGGSLSHVVAGRGGGIIGWGVGQAFSFISIAPWLQILILSLVFAIGLVFACDPLADRLAHRGVRHFERDLDFIDNNEAKAVLRQIAHYVTTRSL